MKMPLSSMKSFSFHGKSRSHSGTLKKAKKNIIFKCVYSIFQFINVQSPPPRDRLSSRLGSSEQKIMGRSLFISL